MKTIHFTKMQGAGNDFVVLDETQGLLGLTPQDYQRLGDRHFGVGADQILSVRAPSRAGIDFDYIIHNNDGTEVEHCGNGARCLLRFVREQGLTSKTVITVRTKNRILTLIEQPDGQVTVDMGSPTFDPALIPYVPPHQDDTAQNVAALLPTQPTLWDCVLSMGNPHAICLVDDVMPLAIEPLAQRIQNHPAFPQGVNVGFMQIVSRSRALLRVYERGAGETLACGTGACAAVVAGIIMGRLDERVQIQLRGGELSIEWSAHAPHATVKMTGPATTVYHGTIQLGTL